MKRNILIRLQQLCKIMSAIFFILTVYFLTIFAAEMYVNHQTLHADMAFDSGDGEPIYITDQLYICIKKAERIGMPEFIEGINALGKDVEGYNQIPVEGDESLSMRKDNPNASPSPLVVILDVYNSDEEYAHYMSYKQFQLKLNNGKLIKPHKAWQEKLAELQIYTGTEESNIIPPDEAVFITLVFAVPSDEESYKDAEIRLLDGSESEMFAKKIDMPITYKENAPINDQAPAYEKAARTGMLAFGSFIVLFFAYLYMNYRAKDDEDGNPHTKQNQKRKDKNIAKKRKEEGK